MKLITTKPSKKFSPEFGWLKVIDFKILGFKFWTEYHKMEVPENVEQTALCQILAERQVLHSEMTANLPELSNLEFDKFQQQIKNNY